MTFRIGLILAALLALPLSAAPAPSAEPAEPPLPAQHEPFAGEPFFLLSDATFGSADRAQVRLEVNSPSSLASSGGVDIVVYRIGQPLEFLQRQRNLHRVQVDNAPAGEGLANTLTHLWDNAVVKARLAWQKLFSAEARKAVTAEAPALKTPKALTEPSRFEEPRQFKPIPGLPVVERFRYPVPYAKAIAPPKDLKLAGSSSEFIQPSEGNVFVPLGRRAPGLYLVEAIAGQHRATTLLFVSDTVALTKVSGNEMLVWTSQRADGSAVPGTRVVWSDGVGVLKRGETDREGLVRLVRAGPEQSYVFGEDPQGGVFISESFYYDSEIYAAKVYAVTDRPLYRPGDAVQVKVTGREFRSARESVPLADATMELVVLDPAGQPVATEALAFSGRTGADTRFVLPDNAVAGGYELRMAMGEASYSAAFRVADYRKPHFEILVAPDKADFATGDKVSGTLQLAYPDGKPVSHARISLSARAQQLTMVEGELDFTGAFPLKLAQMELETGSDGRASFVLPAAEQPSRYILTALATDGAAYRVRASREILVERGSASLRLVAARQFSRPAETIEFRFAASTRQAAGAPPPRATRWDWVRLEDRSSDKGTLAPGAERLSLAFPKPGSYTLTLRDDAGRIVGATSHWVSGEGQKAPAGSIGIVFDKPRYRAGETAEALVTFPQPAAEALVTLERDKVEAAALLTRGGAGLATERLNATQWRVKLRVTEAMSPNLTLSVAVVKSGDFIFQNQGLLVEQPRIDLAFKADKEVYAPGDTVQVELATTVAGKPVPAEVAVGVVDEMIYVLQPEIAPGIDEFFYHPRRNNVRTSASLAFIGYDLATSKLGNVPARGQVNERAVKVLERPRRDDVDTAAWLPRLQTDASGHARFSFTMPDSLTRWRITGRAIAAAGPAAGLVGQQSAWVRSEKDFYAKWTSPDWQREGDRAEAMVAIFNQAREERAVEWEAAGPGIARRETVKLKPGANFVALPLAAGAPGALEISLTLRSDGKVVDRLQAPLRRLPVAWRSPREAVLDLAAGPPALALPADATRVRVSFANDAAAGAFSRWVDELVDYPYGCVEQTASRMLPLALALQSLAPAQRPLAAMLTQRLASARLRLAQMAGPEAKFGWWGRGMAEDPFLTTYAYYADWRASRALRLALPEEHWQRLLDVYAKGGARGAPMQRALALAWMQEMGLPVGSLASALVEETSALAPGDIEGLGEKRVSVAMSEEGLARSRDAALVLAVHTAGLAQRPVTAAHRAAADAAAVRLASVPAPLVQALLLVTQHGGPEKAAALLAQVRGDWPTFDRAVALVWIQRALGGSPELRPETAALAAPWQRSTGPMGQAAWRLPVGAPLPERLAWGGDARPALAYVAYESSEVEKASLPVKIERSLWRLVPIARVAREAGSAPADAQAQMVDSARLDVKLEEVNPGTPLDSNALYLDQVSVSSEKPMRWALLEVALPPGAAVEASTWGIGIASGESAASQPLERAMQEDIPGGYAVPVEQLAANGSFVARHLVRFAQRGEFRLPPARLYRMYEPEGKGLDTSGRWAAMAVR